MLKTIELYNFKGHKNTQLSLDDSRLHAMVGQNSSGKTSVLQALHYLARLADAQFKSIFGHERSPEHITTIGEPELSVVVSGFWDYRGYKSAKRWQASYRIERNQNTGSWYPKATGQIDGENKKTVEGWNSSLSEAPQPIPTALRHTVHLKLVAENLAKAAYSEETTPQVAFDGSGLAPTLDYLRNEHPDKLEALQEMLRQIVPGVKRVGIRRAKVMVNRQRLLEIDGKSISYEESQEVAGQEVVLDMNTGERIPAHAISEGTMLALGLLTVLHNPQLPNLVLLDDIEQGLHPKAQQELIAVFKQIVAKERNLQIIFSTHSPYILDELEASQVHVLSNAASGFTVSKRLDEHPDAVWAKQTLTTGEFWDATGEDWVAEEVESKGHE